MIQTINVYDFRDAFHRMDRGNQFSYEALGMIFDHFEDCDPEMELDVIAICCDFEEMHYSDIIGQYETDICDHLAGDSTEEEQIEYIENWLNDQTFVIGQSSDGTFVFQNF